MVKFLSSLGLTVNSNTKARGHQGFYLNNRIDISKNIDYKRKIEVLIHEFSHYIHYKLDKNLSKNNATLEVLFPNSDLKRIEDELILVTEFVTNTKTQTKLYELKENNQKEIKGILNTIKSIHPNFKITDKNNILEKSIKKTNAKYLLKYDKIRVKTILWGKEDFYSIDNMETDFPCLSETEKLYIKLKSKQRYQKRLNSRLSKLNRYYHKPTELFARFVEGLYIDTQKVSELAPHTYLVFCAELSKNRYPELADFINNFF